MWYVRNNPILLDEYDIIKLLQSELHSSGIYKLADIKPLSNNIMVSCPNHSNGLESNASCGILRDNFNNKMIVHCFTCGYVDTLEGFISNCFNKTDLGIYGRKWLNELIYTVNDDRDLSDLEFWNKPEQTNTLIDYLSITKYKQYHPYMKERRISEEVAELFELGFDPEFKLDENTTLQCITFPVKDEFGDIIGIQRRSVYSKIFHNFKSSKKPIYGLYECIKANAVDIFVCESIIDCLILWTWGYHAIALMGTGSKDQYELLRRCNVRSLILALDGDNAGYLGRTKIRKNVDNKLIEDLPIPDGKDIGDLTREEFEELRLKIC